MRVIGHLPNEVIASAFSDYLYVQGITNLVEAEKDGWAIWIYSEDELEKAKESLRDFLTNPHDTKYKKNAQQAAELKMLSYVIRAPRTKAKNSNHRVSSYCCVKFSAALNPC